MVHQVDGHSSNCFTCIFSVIQFSLIYSDNQMHYSNEGLMQNPNTFSAHKLLGSFVFKTYTSILIFIAVKMEFAELIRISRCDRVMLHRPHFPVLDGTLCITGHHLIVSAHGEEPEELWVNLKDVIKCIFLYICRTSGLKSISSFSIFKVLSLRESASLVFIILDISSFLSLAFYSCLNSY